MSVVSQQLPAERRGDGWLLVRRPLVLALALGCAVSSLASGRLSVRLIADGAISFAFVPVIEIGTFAVVYLTAARKRSFARAVDLFFAGNTPWLLWLVWIAALGAVTAPTRGASALLLLQVTAVLPASCSAYLDFHFFREVMDRPAPARDVAVNRAIGWSCAALYFVGIAAWPYVAEWTGL